MRLKELNDLSKVTHTKGQSGEVKSAELESPLVYVVLLPSYILFLI